VSSAARKTAKVNFKHPNCDFLHILWFGLRREFRFLSDKMHYGKIGEVLAKK